MTGAGNDGHLEGARVLEHGFGCLNIIKTGEQMHNVKRKRFFRFQQLQRVGMEKTYLRDARESGGSCKAISTTEGHVTFASDDVDWCLDLEGSTKVSNSVP